MMENATEARNPGPTRYVLKSVRLIRYIHEDNDRFPHVFYQSTLGLAKRFDSATEASIYAIEHGITDVEVVAV